MKPVLEELDREMRALHEGGAPIRRCEVHEQAADLLGTDPNARRFHLTHAFVFALEAGDWPRAAGLERALREAGGL